MINVTPCTPGQALAALELAWDLDLPAILWGAPGAGKTSIARELARRKSGGLREVRLDQKVASELGGYPAHDHALRKMVYYPPDFWPDERVDGPTGLLLLDDLPGADDQTRIVTNGLLLDRQIGSYRLPDGWRVVATGNRPEDDPTCREFGPATNDRVIHLVVEPELTDWLRWAVAHAIAPEVMAFLRCFPQHLTADPRSVQRGDAVLPSPRSWERVSNVVKRQPDRLRLRALVDGLVGAAVAQDFFVFLEDAAGVASVERLLAAPRHDLGRLVPTTLHGLYVLCYALAAMVRRETLGPILEVIDCLDRLSGSAHDALPMAEVQTLATSLVIERAFELDLDCSEHPAFQRLDARRRGEQAAAEAGLAAASLLA